MGMLATAVVGISWVAVKRITGVYPIHPEFSETYAAILSATLVTVVFSYIKIGSNNKKLKVSKKE